MKYLKIVAALLLASIIAIFISAPTVYMKSFFDGITVWAYNVLPALFPFAVISALLIKLLPSAKRSATQKLFGINCDHVLAISLLCGYPLGAKAIADSNADVDSATRMCAFCSTAGPVFIIATVGAKLLNSPSATLVILVSQVLGATFNGFVFKPISGNERKITLPLHSSVNLGDTVTNSALSVISVGGLIAIFYMITDMLKSFLPPALQNNVAFNFAVGLLEMTNGIIAISKTAPLTVATVLASALLSFGGLCVLAQCYTFLDKKDIPFGKMLTMKITQCLFTTVVSIVLTAIFLR